MYAMIAKSPDMQILISNVHVSRVNSLTAGLDGPRLAENQRLPCALVMLGLDRWSIRQDELSHEPFSDREKEIYGRDCRRPLVPATGTVT